MTPCFRLSYVNITSHWITCVLRWKSLACYSANLLVTYIVHYGNLVHMSPVFPSKELFNAFRHLNDATMMLFLQHNWSPTCCRRAVGRNSWPRLRTRGSFRLNTPVIDDAIKSSGARLRHGHRRVLFTDSDEIIMPIQTRNNCRINPPVWTETYNNLNK